MLAGYLVSPLESSSIAGSLTVVERNS